MVRQSDLLTGEERELLSLLTQVESGFASVISPGPMRKHDRQQALSAIDALRRMVGAQAAARVFSVEFRLMGEAAQPTNQTTKQSKD